MKTFEEACEKTFVAVIRGPKSKPPTEAEKEAAMDPIKTESDRYATLHDEIQCSFYGRTLAGSLLDQVERGDAARSGARGRLQSWRDGGRGDGKTMIIPAAMFIEAARDQLKTIPAAVLLDQRRELRVAVGIEASENFRRGYELGLQTARVLLETMPAAVAAGVKL